ncbi:uncharacterized protein EMH_0062690 [Eimeria mitis]|uniref:Uncharacterized protein n=1 Tax=Eimeria mitis TaxID=44415 RepID=U6JZV4_9EIME|nr:uncharacterized protein EMH_0062690 [Eimeria mitis]CDJ30949.1 hypothetical protein, conserved [Eimeria mitis]
MLGDSTLSLNSGQAAARGAFYPGADAARGYGAYDSPALPQQQQQQQHQLTLADLPVETESQQSEASGVIADERRGAHMRAKNSLLQVFINFFRKPHLFKVLVFAFVMFASFFFVGIFARIAQFVFGIWAALKVLQLLEEDDVPVPGGGPPPAFSSPAAHNMD